LLKLIAEKTQLKGSNRRRRGDPMKKVLTIILCTGILFMMMSIPLYAVDISLDWLFRTRYMANNFPIGAGVGTHANHTDHGYSLVDQRIDLSMTAKVSDDLKGVIVLTNGNNSMHPFSFPQWGRNGVGHSRSRRTVSTNTGQSGLIPHTHTYTYFDDSDDINSTFFGELKFRNAYIDFNLPNPCLPLNFKVGRQQLKVGHGIVFSGSPDAIAITSKYNNISFGFWTAKISEGSITESDDWDMYTLWAKCSPIPNHTFGATFLYEYGKSGSIYDQQWAYNGSSNPVALANFTEKVKYKPWIISLTADGTIDSITYQAEFDYMGGKIEDNELKGGDLDISAWAAMMGADYNLSSLCKRPAKVGVEVAYGSGEEDDNGNPDRRGDYNGFLMHDPEWWYADLMSDLIGLYLLNGLNNRAYIKVRGEIKPIDKITCNFAYLYNWAPETNSESRYEGHHHFMGHEFDIAATYEIFKNLTFELKYAYLIAGDYFEDPDGESPTNPYGITGNFIFKF
jgi:hypothetical protein